MDRAALRRDVRGLKMQEGLGEVETGAGLWEKQNFQPGSPLWAIRKEVRQSLGVREDTWMANRGRKKLESNRNFPITPQRQTSASEGSLGVAATEDQRENTNTGEAGRWRSQRPGGLVARGAKTRA